MRSKRPETIIPARPTDHLRRILRLPQCRKAHLRIKAKVVNPASARPVVGASPDEMGPAAEHRTTAADVECHSIRRMPGETVQGTRVSRVATTGATTDPDIHRMVLVPAACRSSLDRITLRSRVPV